MNLFEYIKFIWDNRKWTEYVIRTWKIPLCECYDYMKDSDCEHMAELRKQMKDLWFPTK